MKLLVVGGGGREHAIIRKLNESPQVRQVYCAPGNGGIAETQSACPSAPCDIDSMVAFAKDNAM